MITGYDGKTARTADGRILHSGMLIWVAGVSGNIPVGMDRPGIITGGRIKVDRFNQVAGYDHVYAIGDVAAVISQETPNGHPMLAPVAIQQARNLAGNLAFISEGQGRAVRPFVFPSGPFEHIHSFDHCIVHKGSVITLEEMEEVIPGVLHHHEWFDGSGYPDGLQGERIPLQARIVAIVDAFDALTTDRPYRQASSTVEALDILDRNSGSHFDPGLLKIFRLLHSQPRR